MSTSAASRRDDVRTGSAPSPARPSALGRLEDRRQARRVKLVRALFVSGLLTWTSLAGWWATYFYRTTQAVQDATLQRYAAEQQLLARDLLDDHEGSEVAELPAHLALEPVPLSDETLRYPHLVIEWPGTETQRAIVVSAAERKRLHAEWRNKLVMLAGEGSLLIGLLLVSIVALYRLLLSEWRLNRQTETFVHAVTHELKSPLAGLRALLQSLATLEVPQDERRAYLELGLAEVQRLDHLVGNVLLSSRLEGAGFLPQLADCDVRVALEHVYDRKRLLFEERGGALTIQAAEVRARMDPEALETILENLVDNALKYSPDRPTVVLRASGDARTVRIEVRDNGIGLDETERAQVFERFFRSPNGARTQAKGTGLGLFIARGLARSCDGDLRVDSGGKGRGTTFTLELPATA